MTLSTHRAMAESRVLTIRPSNSGLVEPPLGGSERSYNMEQRGRKPCLWSVPSIFYKLNEKETFYANNTG